MALDTKTMFLIGGAAALGIFLATRKGDEKETGGGSGTGGGGAPPALRTYTIRGVGNDGSARNFTFAWNPTAASDEVKLQAKIAELIALNPKAATGWQKGLVLTIPPTWPSAPAEFAARDVSSIDIDALRSNALAFVSDPLMQKKSV